ncbi:hypothetical protein P9112_012500 [Eukaryota sp. TZLM1-RC]
MEILPIPSLEPFSIKNSFSIRIYNSCFSLPNLLVGSFGKCRPSPISALSFCRCIVKFANSEVLLNFWFGNDSDKSHTYDLDIHCIPVTSRSTFSKFQQKTSPTLLLITHVDNWIEAQVTKQEIEQLKAQDGLSVLYMAIGDGITDEDDFFNKRNEVVTHVLDVLNLNP